MVSRKYEIYFANILGIVHTYFLLYLLGGPRPAPCRGGSGGPFNSNEKLKSVAMTAGLIAIQRET